MTPTLPGKSPIALQLAAARTMFRALRSAQAAIGSDCAYLLLLVTHHAERADRRCGQLEAE